MNRIISRVALAALITSTVAPVAQAKGWTSNSDFFKHAMLPCAALMAAGKAISSGYKWYKKDELASIAAKQEVARQKRTEITALETRISELEQLKKSLPSSRTTYLASEEDKQFLAKLIDQIDQAAGVPAELHAAIDGLIKTHKQTIEAKRKEIPEISTKLTLGDYGDVICGTGALVAGTAAIMRFSDLYPGPTFVACIMGLAYCLTAK